MTSYKHTTSLLVATAILTSCLSVIGAEHGKGAKKSSKAAISVSPVNPSAAGLLTTEKGGTAEFQVRLASEPTADVMINLSSSNLEEGSVATSALTFTSADWNTPQIVIVTGVDDDALDGNMDYWVVLDPATSVDLDYSGLDPVYVELTNIDDDALVMTDAIYVRDFYADEPQQRGPHADFRFIVDVGVTNDTDGAGVQVVVSVYDSNQTNLNSESNIWNFLGTTDSNGIYLTPWLKGLVPGEYWVEVHDLALAGYLWDPLDTLEWDLQDEDSDGRPDFVLPVN